jgi:hypothetical protein
LLWYFNTDTNIQAIGPQIPQHITEEMSPKESGYMLVIPQGEPVSTRGRLSAVQLWSIESGAMAVMVIKSVVLHFSTLAVYMNTFICLFIFI